MLIPGTGIRVDEKLCTGCGTCHYICPVTPKAVRMQPRATQPPSASQAELPAQKGEPPC
jgi:ferredoxin